MADPKAPRVARRPSLPTSSWGAPPLPPDLVEAGARRVGFIGLVAALTAPVAYLAERSIQPGRLAVSGPLPFPELGMAVLATLGLALFVLALLRKAPAPLLLDLGLIFEVAGALAIAVSEHAGPWPPGITIRGISWNCVWITIFVVAVPSSYGKTVLAAGAAALMQPLGLALTHAINSDPLPPAGQMLLLVAPVFAAAGWSIPFARHLHALRSRVSKEREMGSYRLAEQIAAGGMGEVWRAEHRMLARPAAIKLIRPGAAGDAEVMLRRFEREARATALLRSPHTVALYDYGMTDRGELYYVMELLDGIDLDDLVTRFGPLPPERVVYALRQACNSLAEAHERGLVHRDIKPRNLMLCRLGIQYDFLKVLDFGLAKYAGPEPQTQLTSEGVAAGTPAFMAPEAALGAREVDGRADLYGLGCVAWWLLAGRLVFERATPLAMAMAHLNEPPPPLSDVPPALETVVLQCLEKDPARRPQSARELDARLAEAAASWTAEDAERWWKTNLPERTG